MSHNSKNSISSLLFLSASFPISNSSSSSVAKDDDDDDTSGEQLENMRISIRGKKRGRRAAAAAARQRKSQTRNEPAKSRDLFFFLMQNYDNCLFTSLFFSLLPLRERERKKDKQKKEQQQQPFSGLCGRRKRKRIS